LKETPDSSWKKENKDKEDDPHKELPKNHSFDLCVDADQHPEGNDHSCPNDGTEERSHSSYQGHDDHVPGPNPIKGLRKHIVKEEPIKRPGHGGVNG